MRKTIFFVMLLLAVIVLGVTSCKKNGDKCWKVTFVQTFPDGQTSSAIDYFWGTESAADAAIAEDIKSLEDVTKTQISPTKEEASGAKTQADCDAMRAALRNK